MAEEKKVKDMTDEEQTRLAHTLDDLKLYRLNDIAAKLGVTYRTMLTYVKTGRLQGAKIGGAWYITEENLAKFLNGDK